MKTQTKWIAPQGGGVPLLTMPNIPFPLHGLAPRVIMGAAEWDKLRKQCYLDAGDKCEICGQQLCGKRNSDYPMHAAHEVYEYDFEKLEARFIRPVCLCPTCVDEDTEVLTGDGWKKIPTVTEDDKVACWDKDNSIEFLNPTDAVLTHPAEAIEITRGDKSLFFSPDHRLLLKVASKQSPSYGQTKVVLAKDYKASHYYNWITGGNGKGDNHLTSLERLYIAIEADGHLEYDKENPRGKERQRARSDRYQTAEYRYTYTVRLGKERKIRRFAQLLQESGVKYEERAETGGEKGWVVWLNVDVKHFANCFKMDMPSEKAQEFLEELVFWDGSYSNGSTCWYTNKLEEADFVQGVAVQCNMLANISVVNRLGNLRKGQWKTPYERLSYNVSINTLRTEYCAKEMVPTTIKWNKPMYCLTVPTSFFVARRDGVVFVTGNCHTGFIHSGRAITCYTNHEPLWTKESMLRAAEHGFKLIADWNIANPDEPLYVYETFTEWLREPSLATELQSLMGKYCIEMWCVPHRKEWDNAWGKWKLIYNGVEYYSPYQSREEWEDATRGQHPKESKELFAGDEFEALRRNIKERNKK